jgi:polyisoprenoid-binding protein YceI
MNKLVSIGAAAIVVMAPSTAAEATLSSPTDAHVVFDASGPAGLKIEGTTSDINVAEDSGNVVITVPLANLTTGISLRDHHMREKYLEVPKFPAAILTIPRVALKFPNPGEKVEADAQGTITLHGQSHPVAVHYDTKDDGSALAAHGVFRLNASRFGFSDDDRAASSFLGGGHRRWRRAVSLRGACEGLPVDDPTRLLGVHAVPHRPLRRRRRADGVRARAERSTSSNAVRRRGG